MARTRRSLLGLFSRVALAAGPLGGLLGIPPARAVAAEGATLAAYLDALIPDDDLGPGAVTLGIDKRIAALAVEIANYRRLLGQGCRWLDERARELGATGFAGLDGPGRDRVIQLAAASDPKTPPRQFFERTRSDAFFRYYARTEAWAAIGYDGPPQPAGFMDYALPPKRRT